MIVSALPAATRAPASGRLRGLEPPVAVAVEVDDAGDRALRGQWNIHEEALQAHRH